MIMAIYLFVTGLGFGRSSLTFEQTTIQSFLTWGSIFLMFLGPALTMRLFAEEEKLGTLELLLTSPVRDVEVVLGKYFAALGMFIIMNGITFYYPLLLAWFGHPDWGPIFSGYLGLILIGAVFISIGLFTSSLTSNQILAYALGSIFILALWFIGYATGEAGEALEKFFRFISIFAYLDFSQGVIDTNTVISYISICLVFLFLTVRSLETRKWR
jgi:ABC-2 type transport system permease protein